MVMMVMMLSLQMLRPLAHLQMLHRVQLSLQQQVARELQSQQQQVQQAPISALAQMHLCTTTRTRWMVMMVMMLSVQMLHPLAHLQMLHRVKLSLQQQVHQEMPPGDALWEMHFGALRIACWHRRTRHAVDLVQCRAACAGKGMHLCRGQGSCSPGAGNWQRALAAVVNWLRAKEQACTGCSITTAEAAELTPEVLAAIAESMPTLDDRPKKYPKLGC